MTPRPLSLVPPLPAPPDVPALVLRAAQAAAAQLAAAARTAARGEARRLINDHYPHRRGTRLALVARVDALVAGLPAPPLHSHVPVALLARVDALAAAARTGATP